MSKEKTARVKTPTFRVSFPAIFKPVSFENQPAKYSVEMLFDKKTDLTELKRAVLKAATDKWGDKTKWPKNLKLPFKDGNEKSDLQGYADHTVIRASSKNRPGLVNQKLEPITEEDGSFYAGCYARASVTPFAYDKAGNRGVSFGLQNVQKVKDGEPFSGRKRAEDDFEEIEMGGDNETSYQDSSDSDDLDSLM